MALAHDYYCYAMLGVGEARAKHASQVSRTFGASE